MTNNRLCPTCRNPLQTNTCKKCGYKHVVLQVVDTHQEFAVFNYRKKIRNTGQDLEIVRKLSRQQKLSIYLREFQKLVKNASQNLCGAKQLSITQSLQFKEQVKIIWQSFLLKKRNIQSSIAGIFKKYISNQKEKEDNHLALQTVNQQKQESKEDASQGSQEEREKQDEGATSPRKRSRKKRNIPKDLSPLTQFRSYLKVSVKPLIPESIQERKLSSNDLTSAQKSFLSYLLANTKTNKELVQITSYKYIKLLFTVNNSKLHKSYIKESLINSEIFKRNIKPMKNKQDSILLIMLYDLLLCQNSIETYNQKTSLRELISLYEANSQKSSIVEMILEQLETTNTKEIDSPDIPQISFELIYSIIHLAAVSTGLTFTLGELITAVGRLSISKIQVQQNLFLRGVPNEEVISCDRVRKSSHLLAHFLNLSFSCCMSKWTVKWCKKLDLQLYTNIIDIINTTLFEQAKLKFKTSHPEDYIGAIHKYNKFYELEQDIASTVGIMVFLKLAHGLNDYPYLVQTNPEELSRCFTIESQQFSNLKKLLQNKKITVCEKEKLDSSVTKIIPQPYKEPFNLGSFTKKLSKLNKIDKTLGYQTSNSQMIRLRNLSHLNGVSSIELLSFFQKNAEEQKNDRSQPIKLRYAQMQHMQWLQKQKKQSKMPTTKVKASIEKEKVDLHEHLKNQLQCIINHHEQVTDGEGDSIIECLIDKPSSNYEMMYEYTSDYLQLVNREEQLWIMEQLCMNHCTYNQFTHWLTAYQSVLKLFERQ